MSNYQTTIEEVVNFITVDNLRKDGYSNEQVIEIVSDLSGGMVHNFLTKYNTWITNGRPNPLTWNA